MPQRTPASEEPSIVADIAHGALLGDFAPELGFPGAATQVALTFVPIVGTLCSLRDVVANRRQGDRAGVILNLLSILPVVGGLAKAAEVARHTGRLQRGLAVSVRRHRSASAPRRAYSPLAGR